MFNNTLTDIFRAAIFKATLFRSPNFVRSMYTVHIGRKNIFISLILIFVLNVYFDKSSKGTYLCLSRLVNKYQVIMGNLHKTHNKFSSGHKRYF